MNWKENASAVLENDQVQMRPVTEADRAAIRELAKDGHIWRYFVSRVGTDAEFDTFFSGMLADQASGARAVYVVVDKTTGAVAGSMSYGNLFEKDARLEIGWSWLGEAFRGKGINRWAKFLLLQHAFEALGAQRVEFKTDVLNFQARAGLRNIGAQEEGVLRSFNYMPGGRRRDAIFYSVLAAEWPAIKQGLLTQEKLRQPAEAQA